MTLSGESTYQRAKAHLRKLRLCSSGRTACVYHGLLHSFCSVAALPTGAGDIDNAKFWLATLIDEKGPSPCLPQKSASAIVCELRLWAQLLKVIPVSQAAVAFVAQQYIGPSYRS